MSESDNWATPEMVRAITRIDNNVTQLQADLKAQGQSYVPRAEFELVRQGYDREFRDIKAAKAPWWVVVMAALTLAGVAAVYIPLLAN